MTQWAELLKAIAAILWPGVAFTALALYHREIRNLLQRFRKGKLFGQEVELTEPLDQLQLAASTAELEVRALPPPADSKSLASVVAQTAESVPDRILCLAVTSPKAALLLLASELEGTLTRLLANLGLLGGRGFVPLTEGIRILRTRGGLPPNVGTSVELFYGLRNRLVHGRNVSDDDVLRAIDSGIAIYRTLESIPHEINYVYHPGVPLYSNRACTQEITGAKGVVLETHSSDGSTRTLRIFPSTRSHFRKGEPVAWEWSPEHRFDEAWYRHPDTAVETYAWSASMEFVGRHLSEL
jgi:hypothetical protein